MNQIVPFLSTIADCQVLSVNNGRCTAADCPKTCYWDYVCVRDEKNEIAFLDLASPSTEALIIRQLFICSYTRTCTWIVKNLAYFPRPPFIPVLGRFFPLLQD